MHKILRTTLLAAALCASASAQAAIQTYSFSGTLDSGFFSGQSFSGQVSFEDASFTGSGIEYAAVSSLYISIFGGNFTEANTDLGTTAEVAMDGGIFAGASFYATGVNAAFSMLPADFASSSVAFLAYDTGLGSSGAGSVIYAPVPEPETWAMLLMGLGLVSLKFRTRNKHFTLSHTGV